MAFMWDKIMYNCIYHWIEKIASTISVWAWHKRERLLRKGRNSKRQGYNPWVQE